MEVRCGQHVRDFLGWPEGEETYIVDAAGLLFQGRALRTFSNKDETQVLPFYALGSFQKDVPGPGKTQVASVYHDEWKLVPYFMDSRMLQGLG